MTCSNISHPLQILKLVGNDINTIESNTFTELSHLQTLDLTANKLTVIHRDTWRGLQSLTELMQS